MDAQVAQAVAELFKELVHGPTVRGEAFILNSGDIGLLRSLGNVSAAQASVRVDGGGTIAAHAQHLRYGLQLMNRWAHEGGNPFADAKWDEAWKVGGVDQAEWDEILAGLRSESDRWIEALQTPRQTSEVEAKGMLASVAHLAYHLGAIRQIAKSARGPKEGTF